MLSIATAAIGQRDERAEEDSDVALLALQAAVKRNKLVRHKAKSQNRLIVRARMRDPARGGKVRQPGATAVVSAYEAGGRRLKFLRRPGTRNGTSVGCCADEGERAGARAAAGRLGELEDRWLEGRRFECDHRPCPDRRQTRSGATQFFQTLRASAFGGEKLRTKRTVMASTSSRSCAAFQTRSGAVRFLGVVLQSSFTVHV